MVYDVCRTIARYDDMILMRVINYMAGFLSVRVHVFECTKGRLGKE